MSTQWSQTFMHAVPWCPVSVPSKLDGIFELRQYVAHPGQLGNWAAAFQKGLAARLQYRHELLFLVDWFNTGLMVCLALSAFTLRVIFGIVSV